jgi:co-chaperonin GroES (HSP10)
MIQAPMNNLIVKVKTKYIGNISKLLQLSAIQNGSSVDSVDLVNIMGEVVSLPKVVTEDVGHKDFSIDEIQVGDTAIFSYNIIHDFVIEGPDKEPVYKNRLFYEGEEYFLADINKVFGYIRDNEIKMINGYVMTGPYQESTIIIPNELKKIKKAAETYLMHYDFPNKGDKKLDISMDDTIYFSPFSAQKYQINDKKFCILRQNKIFGKSIVE